MSAVEATAEAEQAAISCCRAPQPPASSPGNPQPGVRLRPPPKPAAPQTVQPYLPRARSGAKYKKLVAKAKAEAALPKYEPFLVPSINFP